MSESIEHIEAEISRLVLERQELRRRGTDALVLERNRRELVRLQQWLSLALIARYLPEREAA